MSSPNAFFYGIDNVASAGQFFVALAQRVGEGPLADGEDMATLARAFRLPIPPELAAASIVSIEDGRELDRAALVRDTPVRIVITYPPTDGGTKPDGGPQATAFQKCFEVCQSVKGAKICAKVCVNVKVGLDGVSGSVEAPVSVAF